MFVFTLLFRTSLSPLIFMFDPLTKIDRSSHSNLHQVDETDYTTVSR